MDYTLTTPNPSLHQTFTPVLRPVDRNMTNCDYRLEPSIDDKPKGADTPTVGEELWICGINWPEGFSETFQTQHCKPDTYHQKHGCFSYCEPRHLASPDFVNGIENYIRHWDEKRGDAPFVYCSPRMNSFDGSRQDDKKHRPGSSAASIKVTGLLLVGMFVVSLGLAT